MYLIFDTETTGLPKNWKAPVTDLNNWPRLVQIAWVFTDKTGNVLNKSNYIIKPDGFTIPVEITVYSDRSFTFITKQPPATDLIKKAAGITKGSSNPLKDKVGKITKAQLKEIAEKKLPDLNTDDIEVAMKILAGSARSMGVEIVD